MTRKLLDPDLHNLLQGGGKPVDITDEKGTVVGHYLPHAEFVHMTGFSSTVEIHNARAEARLELERGEVYSSDDVQASLANIRKYWESQR